MTDYALAPMAGYTDLPFRRLCRHFGLKTAYTPLIDSGALVYGNRDNPVILARGEDEPWLAVQVLGSRHEDLRKAALMLDRMPFDAVDFNMGCPVRKVLKRGAGAELTRHADEALTCAKILREQISKPFTVKTRILDETDPEPTVTFCQALEATGVEAIAIHGRLPERIYAGPVAAHVIKAVREALHIPVTANGGIFHLADAQWLGNETGCDRLMVARGAIGNPWLFKELLEQKEYTPSHEEVCAAMEEHVEGMLDLYGRPGGMVVARKIILSYLCKWAYPKKLRAKVNGISTEEDFMPFMAEVRAAKA